MVRKKEEAKDLITEYQELIFTDPQKLTKALAKKDLTIELGMGKGRFINELAQQNPEHLYLGIEVKEERTLSAAKKAKAGELKNIWFYCGDFLLNIEELQKLKAAKIWITFPDPWPKKRHHKRRLLNPKSAPYLKKIFKKGGLLYFKTDHQQLYLDTLETLQNSNFTILQTIEDLHQSDFPIKIKTEFEQKYTKAGKPIYLIVAQN